MNEFYKGFRKYDLEKSKGELISEIYIPELNPHEGSAYLKLSVRKAMDLAIIGTAAWVRMDGKKIEDCRIALGGVAVNAIRAPKAEAFLKGKELTDEVLEQAGNLKQTLKELNRETYDYREFLKKFASLGENLETNEDEFDYIYYIYGMDHYGNMPLVEPLEYKEVKKVREIVIAIDTSESVSGDLVQQFVQKTWNMLKQTDSFFSRVNIHILQCGAKVEEDVSIKSQEDLDAYLKSMMLLKGFGGTDFRPVFEKVNELIRSHAFSNFRGLIYFTDGYGTYPAMPPAYPTAFVFLDQGHEIPGVPPWAIRLVLKEDEIHDL